MEKSISCRFPQHIGKARIPEGLRDALARWPKIPGAIRRAIEALLETVPNQA
jgi:hypothetical protein